MVMHTSINSAITIQNNLSLPVAMAILVSFIYLRSAAVKLLLAMEPGLQAIYIYSHFTVVKPPSTVLTAPLKHVFVSLASYGVPSKRPAISELLPVTVA